MAVAEVRRHMIKVGDIVDGKYRVTRLLGAGGMGIVVEAHHENLDTLVAIKFTRSDMVVANGGAERFLREARALVKLKSQHAVKVHDLGVHGRMPFIVMEHLEGMDMQTMLDKHGPLSVADAARHVRQACEAIAEAHSLGIYHRDLKPANFFLARGASGRIIVKVLDFGIAKTLRPSEDKSERFASLTGVNDLVGTVPYMSPEQFVSARDIDGRADIWSLGVVLYELVTGELPFSGADVFALKEAIRLRPPRMQSIPPSLEPIIRQCLQKRPEDRYQSIVELAIALRPLISESLSPFGPLSERAAIRPAQDVVIRSATASPIPGSQLVIELAAAEGLALPNDSVPPTVRVRVGAEEETIDAGALTQGAVFLQDAVTVRKRGTMAAGGTLLMDDPETPEPPTLRKPPSNGQADLAVQTLRSLPAPARAEPQRARKVALPELRPQVVTVRRGVLVVKQPLKLAMRRRAASRRGTVIAGACALLAAAALGLGISSQAGADSVAARVIAPLWTGAR